jgi:hypothetical protein
MTDKTEELLAAWIDGALSPEEAAAFEQRLEREPELAARAAEWRANDAFIAGAFAPLAQTPIDPALLAKLGLADAPAAPLAANDNPRWWRGRGLVVGGGALAAGLALVLVLTGRPQGPVQTDPLTFALDTTPSLGTAKLPDGQTIQPTVTVRAADGRWCREYRSGADVALACRSAKGWEEIGRGAGGGPDASGDIKLAGGADGAALDAAYAKLGASDPIDAAAEAKLIKDAWR